MGYINGDQELLAENTKSTEKINKISTNGIKTNRKRLEKKKAVKPLMNFIKQLFTKMINL